MAHLRQNRGERWLSDLSAASGETVIKLRMCLSIHLAIALLIHTIIIGYSEQPELKDKSKIRDERRVPLVDQGDSCGLIRVSVLG